MATLAPLIEAIQPVDGRDRKTLDYAARTIREAGFIRTGKSGAGAAQMTFADAASLLIGLNSVDNFADAPAVIPGIANLQGTAFEPDLPSPYFEIAAAPTFGEALVYWLEGAHEMVRIARNFICKAYHPEQREMLLSNVLRDGSFISFAVSIYRFSASIELKLPPEFKRQEPFEKIFHIDFDRPECRNLERWRADRRVSVRFGLPTALAVYQAITGEEIASAADLIERFAE